MSWRDATNDEQDQCQHGLSDELNWNGYRYEPLLSCQQLRWNGYTYVPEMRPECANMYNRSRDD